eukprot:CAMPEP_0180681234 /NCGR_PEP_ID=MMETSP1037_2-20121125/69887_1 /TAXON_ID=632150 /ORGANISM="Azadinium spinosum, Strain 3D9" /LENGTH=165 /DNA_ID=CAMNT_0022711091 /DNA_START=475 /DNA_END=970 /DNA_ORIENTATION=+
MSQERKVPPLSEVHLRGGLAIGDSCEEVLLDALGGARMSGALRQLCMPWGVGKRWEPAVVMRGVGEIGAKPEDFPAAICCAVRTCSREGEGGDDTSMVGKFLFQKRDRLVGVDEDGELPLSSAYPSPLAILGGIRLEADIVEAWSPSMPSRKTGSGRNCSPSGRA